MADPEPRPKLPEAAEEMMQQVAKQSERMIRTRREGRPSFWRSVGIVGVIGWSVALPTLIGVAAGSWIDRRWPTRFSWTLTLLGVGLVLGCVMAWNRIKQEQEDR